jgi:hypothetical protein
LPSRVHSLNPICATSSGRSGFILGEPEAVAATSGAGRGYPDRRVRRPREAAASLATLSGLAWVSTHPFQGRPAVTLGVTDGGERRDRPGCAPAPRRRWRPGVARATALLAAAALVIAALLRGSTAVGPRTSHLRGRPGPDRVKRSGRAAR